MCGRKHFVDIRVSLLPQLDRPKRSIQSYHPPLAIGLLNLERSVLDKGLSSYYNSCQ